MKRMMRLWALPSMSRPASASRGSVRLSWESEQPQGHPQLRRAFLELRTALALARARLGLSTAAVLTQRHRRGASPLPRGAWCPAGLSSPARARSLSPGPRRYRASDQSWGPILPTSASSQSSRSFSSAMMRSVAEDLEAEAAELAGSLRRLAMSAQMPPHREGEAERLVEQRRQVEQEVEHEAKELLAAAVAAGTMMQAAAEAMEAEEMGRARSQRAPSAAVRDEAESRHDSAAPFDGHRLLHHSAAFTSSLVHPSSSSRSPILPLDLSSTLRRVASPSAPWRQPAAERGGNNSVLQGRIGGSRYSLLDPRLVQEEERKTHHLDQEQGEAIAILSPAPALNRSLLSPPPMPSPSAELPLTDLTGRLALRLLPENLRESLLGTPVAQASSEKPRAFEGFDYSLSRSGDSLLDLILTDGGASEELLSYKPSERLAREGVQELRHKQEDESQSKSVVSREPPPSDVERFRTWHRALLLDQEDQPSAHVSATKDGASDSMPLPPPPSSKETATVGAAVLRQLRMDDNSYRAVHLHLRDAELFNREVN